MSNNLDAVRSMYQAFAIGDIPSVLAGLSSNVQWTEAKGGSYGGVSIGPKAVLENVFMKIGRRVGLLRRHSQRVRLGRLDLCCAWRVQRHIQGHRQEFHGSVAHARKFEAGKATSFDQYTDTAMHLEPLQI